MRILIRTSKLAIWSRRLGALGVPLLALALLLHLFGQIGSDVFELCLAIATLAGGLAVPLALVGYVRLWFTGDKGWGIASAGLTLGAVCLVPLGAAGALMTAYPSTADIATSPQNPPELVFPRAGTPDAIDPDLALQAFPRLLSRSYQLEPETLFDIARGVVRGEGWQIVRSRAPAPDGGNGELNAIRKSLLGWSNEVALRVASAPLGAQVDVRGTSVRPAPHDLGSNGRAVENFLVSLDAEVARYLRENVGVVDAGSAE